MVGEKVEFGIVVTNTGNVPLTLSEFNDPNCDEGTITGGPGANPVPPAPTGKTTYFCSHILTESDHLVGKYCNLATVTATPPEGDGEPITLGSNEACTELPTPKDKREFSCKGITFIFEGFPNMQNTVKMHIRVDGVFTPGPTSKDWLEFTFNGPTATYTFPLNLSPGPHSLDGYSKWNTNGFKGGSDRTASVKCAAEPDFTLQKLQKIDGSQDPYTTETLFTSPGGRADYEIIAKNTGNVPLKFSNFTDEGCEEGTITGGPGELAVAPEESTTYFCSRPLTFGGLNYYNTATDTGTPPENQGAPVTRESNTVTVATL
jgi:hypothetical protein